MYRLGMARLSGRTGQHPGASPVTAIGEGHPARQQLLRRHMEARSSRAAPERSAALATGLPRRGPGQPAGVHGQRIQPVAQDCGMARGTVPRGLFGLDTFWPKPIRSGTKQRSPRHGGSHGPIAATTPAARADKATAPCCPMAPHPPGCKRSPSRLGKSWRVWEAWGVTPGTCPLPHGLEAAVGVRNASSRNGSAAARCSRRRRRRTASGPPPTGRYPPRRCARCRQGKQILTDPTAPCGAPPHHEPQGRRAFRPLAHGARLSVTYSVQPSRR